MRACGLTCVVLCLVLGWVRVAMAQDAGVRRGSDAGTPPVPMRAPDTTSDIAPPRVLDQPPAKYPPQHLEARRKATVMLRVTVQKDGTVGEVDVVEPAGPAFDAAAVEAVRKWRFEPAMRGAQPIASRIRIPFRFEPPRPEPVEPARSTAPAPAREAADGKATPKPVQEADSEAAHSDTPIEVTVQGERVARTEARSASDFEVGRDVVAAAPRKEGAEALRSAPGLYIGRAEGVAVAHRYMLRGFDADHGQDIAFRVGGLPINLPSHIHGQGYADLGFLIGDVIRELRITEGVYDPQQGDFAVAGSIDVALGVEPRDRGLHLESGYGNFGTFRQLAMWAPRGAAEESFGAVRYASTDGFGESRAAKSGSGIIQHRFGSGELTYRAIGVLHAARSDMAGVLRRDDIDAGEVCFLCAYPYPTAQRQNALAQRILGGLFADYQQAEGANGQLGLWLGYDNFRVQENFTGFTQRSRTLEGVSGRGDLIEQQNRTLSLGLTGRYRSAPYRPAAWANGTLELGMDGRLDVVDQSQNLLDASVRNQTWDRRIDASIRAVDLGLWGDLDWSFTKYVDARLGVRADVLSYAIEDRLGNFVPATRGEDSFIVGFRRSAMGVAAGPRASVEVHPLRWLSVMAAYGEGFRSPQARTLEDGEPTPFAKVRSADAGLRLDWGRPLHVTLSGFYTRLSNDVAFEAREGRLERIGPTQRLGAVAHAVTRPWPWLVGSVSVTYVDATLLQPPPPTDEEPDPPFREGQSIPFVPPLVVRGDLGARHTFVQDLGGQPLGARAGAGFSFLSARPLPFGNFAEPFGLLDVSAGLSWGPLELSAEIFNLLDAEYAAVEYNFPSDWDPDDGVRPRTPARHIAAGAPLSWRISLGVTL